MEKLEIRSVNRQLSRMYTLSIATVFIFISAIVLNYFFLNNNKVLYVGISLHGIALFFFQPWKIMRNVRELFACQRMLEEITNTKVGKDYV